MKDYSDIQSKPLLLPSPRQPREGEGSNGARGFDRFVGSSGHGSAAAPANFGFDSGGRSAFFDDGPSPMCGPAVLTKLLKKSPPRQQHTNIPEPDHTHSQQQQSSSSSVTSLYYDSSPRQPSSSTAVVQAAAGGGGEDNAGIIKSCLPALHNYSHRHLQYQDLEEPMRSTPGGDTESSSSSTSSSAEKGCGADSTNNASGNSEAEMGGCKSKLDSVQFDSKGAREGKLPSLDCLGGSNDDDDGGTGNIPFSPSKQLLASMIGFKPTQWATPLSAVTEEASSMGSDEQSSSQPQLPSLLDRQHNARTSNGADAASTAVSSVVTTTNAAASSGTVTITGSSQKRQQQQRNAKSAFATVIGSPERNEMLAAMRSLVLKQQAALKEMVNENAKYRSKLSNYQSAMIKMKQKQTESEAMISQLRLEKEALENDARWLREEIKGVGTAFAGGDEDDDTEVQRKLRDLMRGGSFSPNKSADRAASEAFSSFKRSLLVSSSPMSPSFGEEQHQRGRQGNKNNANADHVSPSSPMKMAVKSLNYRKHHQAMASSTANTPTESAVSTPVAAAPVIGARTASPLSPVTMATKCLDDKKYRETQSPSTLLWELHSESDADDTGPDATNPSRSSPFSPVTMASRTLRSDKRLSHSPSTSPFSTLWDVVDATVGASNHNSSTKSQENRRQRQSASPLPPSSSWDAEGRDDNEESEEREALRTVEESERRDACGDDAAAPPKRALDVTASTTMSDSRDESSVLLSADGEESVPSDEKISPSPSPSPTASSKRLNIAREEVIMFKQRLETIQKKRSERQSGRKQTSSRSVRFDTITIK